MYNFVNSSLSFIGKISIIFLTIGPTHPDAMTTSQAKLHFKPQDGLSIQYRYSENKKSSFVRTGMTVPDQTAVRTTIDFTVKCIGHSSDGNMRMEMVINKFVQIYEDSARYEFTTTHNIHIEDMLKDFQGISFNIIVSPAGKVIEYNGYERIDNEHLKTFFPKELFVRLFENISHFLPDSGAEIGSTWEYNNPTVNGDLNNLSANYIFSDLNHGVAMIHTTYAIEQNNLIQGRSIPMKGRGSGQIEVNVESGMPIKFNNLIEVGSESNLGGVKIKQETTYETTIESFLH